MASFLEAMDEFVAEGRGEISDDSILGNDLRRFGASWHSPEGFQAYLADLERKSREPVPSHWVPSTTLWWVDQSTYLGRLSIRHRLNQHLREMGGHIGYDMRPSARRRGHATAMLGAALPLAKALGIDPALITCDTTNLASRRVIEKNGGVLEDERHGKLRFWVPCSKD